MKIFDEKTVILNDGEKNVKIKVYLKEVKVKNNHTKTKAFCRMIREKNTECTSFDDKP